MCVWCLLCKNIQWWGWVVCKRVDGVGKRDCHMYMSQRWVSKKIQSTEASHSTHKCSVWVKRWHLFFISFIPLLYANFVLDMFSHTHTHAFKMLLKRITHHIGCSLLLFSNRFSRNFFASFLCVTDFLSSLEWRVYICNANAVTFEITVWNKTKTTHTHIPFDEINWMNEQCCFHNNLMICAPKTTTNKRHKYIDGGWNHILKYSKRIFTVLLLHIEPSARANVKNSERKWEKRRKR